jgi:thioredoxin 1|tara:strand:+ start:245 stop:565 length:321 start_codon:yes stop_codon:yes gene_type:complete
MSTFPTSDESFDNDIALLDTLVLVDFWAEWCGPCKQIGPILEEISNEKEDKLKILKLNIDENPQTPQKYGVRGIPTLMLFKKGKLIDTKVGSLPKSSLEAWLQDNL